MSSAASDSPSHRTAEDVNIRAYECDEKRPPEEYLARLTGVLGEERIGVLR
jgi:hypothetical protein